MSQDKYEIDVNVEDNPQIPLFHYTSHESLIKIIESGQLYATGIRYLNDATEGRYTEDLFAKYINDYINNFDEKAKDWFLWLKEILSGENELRHSAYVVCFTQEKDLLSQWRAYCPPGAGYSLGFSSEYLIESAKSQGFKLVKCIYDINIQQQLVEMILQQVEDEFLSTPASVLNGELKNIKKKDHSKWNIQLWGKLYRTIQYLAPIIKHPSFKEEQEWRDISRDYTLSLFSEEAKWRTGKNIPIPYILFSLPCINEEKTISELVIGPTPNTELSHITAVKLIKGKGYKCTKFTDSVVPYREW